MQMKPKYSHFLPPTVPPSLPPSHSSVPPSIPPLHLSLSSPSLFPPRQSKMTTTRSTGDIAVDLTEISAPRITKLSSVGSKNQLIMASNGSLVSAGKMKRNNNSSSCCPGRKRASEDALTRS